MAVSIAADTPEFCNQAWKPAGRLKFFVGYWQVSLSPSDPRWNCS